MTTPNMAIHSKHAIATNKKPAAENITATATRKLEPKKKVWINYLDVNETNICRKHTGCEMVRRA